MVNWFKKGRGMSYPVCGMVHIKEPLLLIGKGNPCGSSGFIIIINSNKAVHIGLHFGTNRNMYVRACIHARVYVYATLKYFYTLFYSLLAENKRFGR